MPFALLSDVSAVSDFDWSTALQGVDFNTVFSGMYDLVPVLLPVILSFLGFRKALGFLERKIKGA